MLNRPCTSYIIDSCPKPGRQTLAGVRVVDVCLLPAGPFSGAALVGQGAQVVKIQPDPALGKSMGTEQAEHLVLQLQKSAHDWTLVPQPLALDLRFDHNQRVLDEILQCSQCLIHSFRHLRRMIVHPRLSAGSCLILLAFGSTLCLVPVIYIPSGIVSLAAADRMTFRVFLLVFVLGLAFEEFAESTTESEKDCSLSLLQNNIQRNGARSHEKKPGGIRNDLNVVDSSPEDNPPSALVAESTVKAESSLLKSTFLRDVAHAILNKQAGNRTVAREAARRRARGS
eukprot:symbB.v1.2.001759.t1/scaffold95.1/size600632/7